MEVDKKALYDLNIEKAILGCLIENPKFIIGDVRINKKWFYNDLHRKVFSIIEDLFLSKKPVDIVTLKSLSKDEFLIQDILDSEYSLSNYGFYVDILKNKYVARSLVISVPQKIEWMHKNDRDIVESVSAISSEIRSLMDELHSEEHLKKMGSIGVEVMKAIKEVRMNGVMPFKITSHLKDLDNVIPGYLGGDMVVIAGRPGSGKTSLMMQLAIDNARQGFPVGVLSLEMSKKMLFMRQLSHESGIPIMRLVKGEITDFEWKQLANIWKEIDMLPVYIDDTSSMNEIDLELKARKMKEDYGIEALFIDYLQLLNSSSGENRQQEITKISRKILSISKDLDIPVFALSQLNREVDKRENKRPRLSDLRESGSIEQDSSIVMMLYNPSYYGITEFEDGTPAAGVVEIGVEKFRNGKTGSVRVAFIQERMKFGNLSKETF